MPAYCKKQLFVETIALCQIALFVYAAVSKLMDLENFRVQIGQSPMLSAFAGILSVGVPLTELIIAALIALPKLRILGLYAAFFLMVMFSAYIFIILNFGAFVPCSCGGILEQMGWKEHLAFNLFFVFALALALYFERKAKAVRNNRKLSHFIIRLGIIFTVGSLSVGILYMLSEDIIQHRNNFVRRFPKFSEPENRKYDLGSKTFYFAGAKGSTIYLGNTQAPRVVIAIDTTLKSAHKILIEMDHMDLPFVSVQVRVVPPYFYLTDGTIPCIFKGSTKDWKAKLVANSQVYFSVCEPLSTGSMAIKSIDSKSMRSFIGIVDAQSGKLLHSGKDLLSSDGDGIFDIDGQLLKNGLSDMFHYVHFYKNEFFTIDSTIQRVRRGHTIDTVSSPNLKVKYLKNRGERKLSAPPFVVNRTAAAYGNLLFVNSQLIGKYEDAEVWKEADIIDVYNMNDNSYCSSLYLYHVEKQPMRSFIVRGNTLYMLSGNWLSAVPLDKALVSKYNF